MSDEIKVVAPSHIAPGTAARIFTYVKVEWAGNTLMWSAEPADAGEFLKIETIIDTQGRSDNWYTPNKDSEASYINLKVRMVESDDEDYEYPELK